MNARIDVEAVKNRLAQGSGGYEIVHESPGLEVAVYTLVRRSPTASSRTPTTSSTSSSTAAGRWR